MSKKTTKKKKTTRKRATKKPAATNNTPAKTQEAKPAQVNQVLNWILTGATEYELTEAIEKQWPTVEARPLIAQAITQAAQSAQADPEAVRGWCFEAARHVYKQALGANDFGAALRALKMIGEFSS